MFLDRWRYRYRYKFDMYCTVPKIFFHLSLGRETVFVSSFDIDIDCGLM